MTVIPLKVAKGYPINFLLHYEKLSHFTHDVNGFLHAFDECSWQHAFPKAALLVRIGQKVCEQDETQFQGRRVKVGLKEEQEPITAQGIKRLFLLTRVE